MCDAFKWVFGRFWSEYSETYVIRSPHVERWGEFGCTLLIDLHMKFLESRLTLLFLSSSAEITALVYHPSEHMVVSCSIDSTFKVLHRLKTDNRNRFISNDYDGNIPFSLLSLKRFVQELDVSFRCYRAGMGGWSWHPWRGPWKCLGLEMPFCRFLQV